MLKNMKPAYLALVAIGSMGLTSMPAHACKEITAVALQGSDAAELRVRVNNVILINHKGSHSNTVPANLLLEEDNDFKIELITDNPDATGRAEVFVACEGKWAIHPSQIDLANEVMSPSDEEVTRAKRILDAMAKAESEGKGAVSLDGRLIDYASIRQAEVLVGKSQQIASR